MATIISVIALVVSIETAIFSYVTKQRIQRRERIFRVEMFKLQCLESANIDILRIGSELDRIIKEVKRDANRSGSKIIDVKVIKYIDKISNCHRGAVDVFNAVEHNLNENDVINFRSEIVTCENLIKFSEENGMRLTEDDFNLILDLPNKLATMIDKTIKNLRTEITD